MLLWGTGDHLSYEGYCHLGSGRSPGFRCESRPLPNLVKVSGHCVFDLTGFPSTGYSGGTAADLHCLPYYRDEPKCIHRDLNLLCVVSEPTHHLNLNACVVLCQIALSKCRFYSGTIGYILP